MLGKLVYALDTSKNETNTIAGMKLSLLVGTILATTTPVFANAPHQAEQLNFNVETLGEVIETIVTIRSSEGERWDTVLQSEHKVRVSGNTDSQALGKVFNAGLFPGHCLTSQCSTHPAIWSAEPDQPIVGFKFDVDLTSDDFLTANTGENTSPASWLGEQMIAECNARMGEEGPTVDLTLPVSLPFSFTISTENAGDVRQTTAADFLLNCMAFDGELAELQGDEEVSVATLSEDDVWTGGSSGSSGYTGDEPVFEEDAGFIPHEEEEAEEDEGPGELDLGGLFPFPFPPEDPEVPVAPEVPEVPEEPVVPGVNPDLGDMPDDFVSPDGGVGPDPGPDPNPGIIVVLPPIEPVDPIDPKVNPGLGKLPGDLTVAPDPTHSGNKDKAEKKAIRDALKKKRKAKRKEKKKQKQALLDAQRKKQAAKKKRKAEKKALRDALKKKAKKKKAAKRTNPKPKKKKVVVKKTNGKKAKVKRVTTVKRKPKKAAGKKIVKVKKTRLKVTTAPSKKKRALKAKKKLKKKRKN